MANTFKNPNRKIIMPDAYKSELKDGMRITGVIPWSALNTGGDVLAPDAFKASIEAFARKKNIEITHGVGIADGESKSYEVGGHYANGNFVIDEISVVTPKMTRIMETVKKDSVYLK